MIIKSKELRNYEIHSYSGGGYVVFNPPKGEKGNPKFEKDGQVKKGHPVGFFVSISGAISFIAKKIVVDENLGEISLAQYGVALKSISDGIIKSIESLTLPCPKG